MLGGSMKVSHVGRVELGERFIADQHPHRLDRVRSFDCHPNTYGSMDVVSYQRALSFPYQRHLLLHGNFLVGPRRKQVGGGEGGSWVFRPTNVSGTGFLFRSSRLRAMTSRMSRRCSWRSKKGGDQATLVLPVYAGGSAIGLSATDAYGQSLGR